MPERKLLEAGRDGSGVHPPTLPKVLQSLLPELLHVRQMSDVLRDGPLPVELTMCLLVVDAHEQRAEPRRQTSKALDEVCEHPWRVGERKGPLRPRRTLEIAAGRLTGRNGGLHTPSK